MRPERFPFGDHVHLTSEVMDFHIARARQERAKAIAEFCGQLGASLHGIVARLVGQARPSRRRESGTPQAAR